MLIIGLASCKDNEFGDDTTNRMRGDCDVVLDDFAIEPASRSKGSIEQFSEIVFLNALGIEKTYAVGNEIFLSDEATFTQGDSLDFCYNVESYTTTIKSEDGFEFDFVMESKPYFPELEAAYAADVLKVFYNDSNNTDVSRRLVFRKIIDIKDYPAPLYETTISVGEKFFINNEFQNVETTEFVSPIVTLYYNDNMGIVGYMDEESELWQLKERR